MEVEQTHIVGSDRSQVDELDAEVTKVFRYETLDVLRGIFEKMQRSLDGVERWSVRYNGQVGALLEHLGGRERQLVVARRDLLDSRAVENLRFQEELW